MKYYIQVLMLAFIVLAVFLGLWQYGPIIGVFIHIAPSTAVRVVSEIACLLITIGFIHDLIYGVYIEIRAWNTARYIKKRHNYNIRWTK